MASAGCGAFYRTVLKMSLGVLKEPSTVRGVEVCLTGEPQYLVVFTPKGNSDLCKSPHELQIQETDLSYSRVNRNDFPHSG